MFFIACVVVVVLICTHVLVWNHGKNSGNGA